jgi:branched-subunit amino acid ABC-type transport system permease component
MVQLPNDLITQRSNYPIQGVTMNIEALIASSVDGLMLGFVYGLAAMGLTLIFGVMKVINLAHGPVIALGMFSVYLLGAWFGMNPYLGLLLALVFGLALGAFIYVIAVHRVINAPELTTLLATFSVNLMIIGLGTVAFTTTPRALDVNLGALRVGNVSILGTRFVAVLIAIAVTVGLYYFLYRTRIGKYVRAVANNRAAAELMGINTSAVLALSFGIGTMLAVISGTLLATLFSFTILSGGVYELKSFVIVVLGGLGNPTGALLGGVLLGLLEGVTTMFIPVGWVPVIEYVVFVLILLVRPSGLLGAR